MALTLPDDLQLVQEVPKLKDAFCIGDFAPQEPESGVELWDTNCLNPGIWGRVPGWMSCCFFPAKEAPRKIHTRETYLPKSTSEKSTQTSRTINHIMLLQGSREPKVPPFLGITPFL